MCGRFTLTSTGEILAELYELKDVPEITPRFNIAPTQPVSAVRATADGLGRCLDSLHWGLIPFWADDPGIGARMINARAETVESKPAFRSALAKRRCLVLADGFYEWQAGEDSGGRRGARKQPYYIHMRDARPFAFAALWDHWDKGVGAGTGAPAAAIDSCTIITTEPNELIAPLHRRMPAILGPEHYAAWLDHSGQSTSRLQSLLRPFPAEQMEAYPVGTVVNNPTNDGPRCIEKLS